MPRFIADENFNQAIIRGVLRINPTLDLLTVQHAGLGGTPDPELLDWAANQGRLLLTHDVQTMRKYATDRVAAGLSMPGVIEVADICVVRLIVLDILMLSECSEVGEWDGQIVRLPM